MGKKALSILLLLVFSIGVLTSGCSILNGNDKKDVNIQVTDESETEKRFTVEREEYTISGWISLPKGEGPFPVLVMDMGLMVDGTAFGGLKRRVVADDVAVVRFDYVCSMPENSKSTRTDDWNLTTMAEDTIAVVDGIKTLSYIDPDNVFLFGHSVGGLVSTIAGRELQDEINGMILAEPSFHIQWQFKEEWPTLDDIPETEMVNRGMASFFTEFYDLDLDSLFGYSGKVLIVLAILEDISIGGSADAVVWVEQAMEKFPDCERIDIENTGHDFDSQMGQGEDKTAELAQAVVDFIMENMD